MLFDRFDADLQACGDQPVVEAERNQADGNITKIWGTATIARRTRLSVNLATGLPGGPDASDNLDNSTRNGRFEDGTIKLGSDLKTRLQASFAA